eukprot:scaffold124060_cov14-Tisochrysis_lutea.AAC.1
MLARLYYRQANMSMQPPSSQAPFALDKPLMLQTTFDAFETGQPNDSYDALVLPGSNPGVKPEPMPFFVPTQLASTTCL